MDPQQQAMATALMGGQNSALPSAIAPQPDPSQFQAQNLGYGMPQGQMPQGGMFSPAPYGAQAQQNIYPANMMQGMNA